ncbi:phage tail fiber protein [Neobacillus vireti]|uniref:phage tail fiber protein n=1 Tax=Neobacillus vireti TaxID=220686 RepID=UPI003000ED9E
MATLSLTNYLEGKLAEHVLRNTAYTPAAALYVALHTADPTEAGNVSEVTTAAYTSYARKAVTFNANSGGICASAADLTWNIDGAGVTISHITIWDSVSGATNPLFYGPLNASKTMANGEVFRIPAGSLTVGFD